MTQFSSGSNSPFGLLLATAFRCSVGQVSFVRDVRRAPESHRAAIGESEINENSEASRARSFQMENLLSIEDLLRSHHVLRAALRLAGMQIRKLNFGRQDDPLLQNLRRTLRDARPVARHFSEAHKTEILKGFTVTRVLLPSPPLRRFWGISEHQTRTNRCTTGSY